MDRQALGRRGEAAAAGYLEGRGLTVVDRNWRCRAGEIDIVALEGAVLVFCEVKTRRTRALGSPEESVDRRKQRRILRVAQVYLARAGLDDVDVRFDVVAIDVVGPRAYARHVRNAFQRG